MVSNVLSSLLLRERREWKDELFCWDIASSWVTESSVHEQKVVLLTFPPTKQNLKQTKSLQTFSSLAKRQFFFAINKSQLNHFCVQS